MWLGTRQPREAMKNFLNGIVFMGEGCDNEYPQNSAGKPKKGFVE